MTFKDNNKYFQFQLLPTQPGPALRGKNGRVCRYKPPFSGMLPIRISWTACIKAVDARDLPCMADVESSMLYFCSQVVEYNKVTLTGECADEIFGGYPWFHSQEAFEGAAFPLVHEHGAKTDPALADALMPDSLGMEEYARAAYEKNNPGNPMSCPVRMPHEKRRREIAYLNLRWFMVTLLDRMDRTSMYSGLEAKGSVCRPSGSWNMSSMSPGSMKCPDGIVKGLLRHAGEGLLPREILWRKKSPYPKTI